MEEVVVVEVAAVAVVDLLVHLVVVVQVLNLPLHLHLVQVGLDILHQLVELQTALHHTPGIITTQITTTELFTTTIIE